MKAQFQKVVSGSTAFLAFERIDPEFPFHWHYHPEFELTLIVDSKGQRLVGDGIADYGPGDLVLLGPNLPHSWRSGPTGANLKAFHRAIVVQFRKDFLGEQFFSLKEMDQVSKLLKRSECGLGFTSTKIAREVARKIMELPSASPAQRMVTLLSVLVDLAAESDAEVLSTDRIRPMCRIEDQKRIDAICSYLNSHFEEEINYEALCQKLHMDQASLCRFFRRATGRTMTTYTNELRVGAAAQLLVDTDLNVLEIGFSVGFGNYSNFNRQFKRIKGYGPRTLRQQFATNPGLARNPLSSNVNQR